MKSISCAPILRPQPNTNKMMTRSEPYVQNTPPFLLDNTNLAFPRSAGPSPATRSRPPEKQSRGRRSSVCADACRWNGIGRFIDFRKEASRKFEVYERSKQICETTVDASSRGDRCIHRTRHRKLHCRDAELWFPRRALVRWNSWRQKAWYGAGRQDRRKRTLSTAVRQDYPCSCRPPRESECSRAKIVARIEREISGE